MQAGLETTNLLLGIMAIVSVIEGLVLIGLAVAGFMAYRRVMQLFDELEARHVAPLTARANAILDEVREIAHRVHERTERVDAAIQSTIDRVDGTADRVRSTVQDRASRVVGIVRGIRTAIESFLTTEGGRRPPASATGRL